MDEDFNGLHESTRKTRGAKRAKKTDSNSGLRSFVDRLITLEDQKKRIGLEIKEVLEAGKVAGHNPRALKYVVKHACETEDEQAARLALIAEIEDMKLALGDFANSPLGEAALTRTH